METADTIEILQNGLLKKVQKLIIKNRQLYFLDKEIYLLKDSVQAFFEEPVEQ